MPSSFMNFCRVTDLKKCVKLKFASEISIKKMNHKKTNISEMKTINGFINVIIEEISTLTSHITV